MVMADKIRIKYQGKQTTFTRNKNGTFRVAGKKPTKHQRRIASSLFRQLDRGLKPSIHSARGHTGERGSEEQQRKAFYRKYADVLMTQKQVEENRHLNQGTFVIGGKRIKRSWGSPWRTALQRVKYDWYAIVFVFPVVDENGKVGSPDGVDFGTEDFEEVQRRLAETPMELIIPIWPAGEDIGTAGVEMAAVIDGFEENLAAMLKRLGHVPADKETEEECDPLDAERYVVGLFRHRYDPKTRRDSSMFRE